MAGAVKARKAGIHTTSDWMAIEKERGISVASSVMKFNYRDYEINLLDTPGHQDFSEDTYRVLTAVDSAVMVIDSVKGVEPQTLKLMEVCRMRNTPILTFVNKLDREGMSPLDILADIEENLQIECAPLSWPIGRGTSFKGTYNLYKKELVLFAPGQNCVTDDTVTVRDTDDPLLDDMLGAQAGELREDVALLEGAASPFNLVDFLKGSQTPVFFGSAINNFGVRELLNTFLEIAPAPLPRPTTTRMVFPGEDAFSGFVFKIQANMDPGHRDRIAFMRVCSGCFKRGMRVRHHRIGKDVLISNPIIFMARDRETVDSAWAGDIIGIHNHGTIKIGDTFSEKEPLKYTGIPNFAPEHFRRVHLKTALKAKQLQKGLVQLAEEGAVQLFRPLTESGFILGAVGVLQFDVVIARLKAEYGVDASYETVDYITARWVSSNDKKRLADFESMNRAHLAIGLDDSLTYLAPSEYRLERVMKDWPDISFMKTREHE